MTKEECDEVLKLQENGDTRLFGEIANELGFVDKSAIKKYFHIEN